MNKEIKAQWTAALRSGKYKQGTSLLRMVSSGKQDRFCCLGVLCELAVEAGVTGRQSTTYEVRYGKNDDWSTVVLPLHVQEWAGIGHKAGSYDGGEKSLAGSNDGGMTFPDIADVIDREF